MSSRKMLEDTYVVKLRKFFSQRVSDLRIHKKFYLFGACES